jgi:translation initiation factor IF-3
MGSITPNPKKRSYLLPPGCKDIIDVLQGAPSKPSLGTGYRVNAKILAPEVRVIGERRQQIGIMALSDALRLAQSRGADLVEIAPRAKPPVCCLVDFGMYRHKLAKKAKKTK